MNTLITNKVKRNMRLVSVKLLIVRTILCSNLSQVHNNNYNNNYRSLFLSVYNLFAIHTCSLFFAHDYSLLYWNYYSYRWKEHPLDYLFPQSSRSDHLENFEQKKLYFRSQFSQYHITLYVTMLLIMSRNLSLHAAYRPKVFPKIGS